MIKNIIFKFLDWRKPFFIMQAVNGGTLPGIFMAKINEIPNLTHLKHECEHLNLDLVKYEKLYLLLKKMIDDKKADLVNLTKIVEENHEIILQSYVLNFLLHILFNFKSKKDIAELHKEKHIELHERMSLIISNLYEPD